MAPRRGQRAPASARRECDTALVRAACPGVHLCTSPDWLAPWVLGASRFDADDYEPGAAIPDVAFDAASGELTAVNATDAPRVFYISTPHPCVGRRGAPLAAGRTRPAAVASSTGESEAPCTTLVLLVPPRTLLRAARLLLATPGEALSVEIDVSEWQPTTLPPSLSPSLPCYSFPLGGGPFMCTQSWGGALTHFMSPCSWHAVDFRCAPGTPVLALAPGVIAAVRLLTTPGRTGVRVANLYDWRGLALFDCSVDTTVC